MKSARVIATISARRACDPYVVLLTDFKGSTDDLRAFGFKNHADAVAGIAKQIGAHKIIIGGHDWGGAVVLFDEAVQELNEADT